MSPLTIQEAQLMEKPVLASDVGGVSELIKDNETGFLVKSSSEDWIEKISMLLDDADLQKKIGKEGREHIKNNFSWDKLADDFSKILNEIVSKN